MSTDGNALIEEINPGMFENIDSGSDSDDSLDLSHDISSQIAEPFASLQVSLSNASEEENALHSKEWVEERNKKLIESMLGLENPEINQGMVDFLLQVRKSKERLLD